MFTWDEDNIACLVTCSALISLEQPEITFDEYGSFKIKKLPLWNEIAAARNRKSEADSWARQIDTFYLSAWDATYNSEKDQKSAISELSSVLQNGDKTVTDLAEASYNNYTFHPIAS